MKRSTFEMKDLIMSGSESTKVFQHDVYTIHCTQYAHFHIWRIKHASRALYLLSSFLLFVDNQHCKERYSNCNPKLTVLTFSEDKKIISRHSKIWSDVNVCVIYSGIQYIILWSVLEFFISNSYRFVLDSVFTLRRLIEIHLMGSHEYQIAILLRSFKTDLNRFRKRNVKALLFYDVHNWISVPLLSWASLPV